MSYSTQDPSATSGQRETLSLIAASMVNGTSVYGADGEKIGSIYDVMIDKVRGHVSYAVLSFGGFLGLGENYYPLPWSQLSYSERHGGYLVNLTKEMLEKAPSYPTDASPSWTPDYLGKVDSYYSRKSF